MLLKSAARFFLISPCESATALHAFALCRSGPPPHEFPPGLRSTPPSLRTRSCRLDPRRLGYQTASFARLREIARLLGLDVRDRVEMVQKTAIRNGVRGRLVLPRLPH